MPHVTAIIPARLQSKRFPRKLLFPLPPSGRPLIYYVWKAARRAKSIDRLFVATDSPEIGKAVNAFGGAVIMTSKKPRNGSERAAEATAGFKTDIVINIQGDNLGLTPAVLDRVIGQMSRDRKIKCASLARKINGKNWTKKLFNPDVVKVVVGSSRDALWFSRYPIPYLSHRGNRRAIDVFPYLEHIGIYFYRKATLMEYGSWRQSQCEVAESLEQLRLLENNVPIRMFYTRAEIISIDSKETLKKYKVS